MAWERAGRFGGEFGARIGRKRGVGALLLLLAATAAPLPGAVQEPPVEAAFADLEESGGLRAGGAFPFDYQHLAYAGDGERSEVWAATSVHAGRVRAVYEGGWKYRLAMYAEYWRDGESVAADTSRVSHTLNAVVPETTTDGFPLQTRVLLPPGRYRYRLGVEDLNWSGGGRALNQVEGTILVPPFRARAPLVSSVAIAADSGGAWTPTEDVRLKLNAARIVRRNDRPFVYYEVYGLTPGSDYRGEVRLVSTWTPRGQGETFRGSYQPFQLQYRGTAPAEPAEPVRTTLRLDMSQAEPGPYDVTVRVTDLATGRRSELRRAALKVRSQDARGPVVPVEAIARPDTGPEEGRR